MKFLLLLLLALCSSPSTAHVSCNSPSLEEDALDCYRRVQKEMGGGGFQHFNTLARVLLYLLRTTQAALPDLSQWNAPNFSSKVCQISGVMCASPEEEEGQEMFHPFFCAFKTRQMATPLRQSNKL